MVRAGVLVVGASWVLEKAASECLGSQLCMFGPVERAGCVVGVACKDR